MDQLHDRKFRRAAQQCRPDTVLVVLGVLWPAACQHEPGVVGLQGTQCVGGTVAGPRSLTLAVWAGVPAGTRLFPQQVQHHLNVDIQPDLAHRLEVKQVKDGLGVVIVLLQVLHSNNVITLNLLYLCVRGSPNYQQLLHAGELGGGAEGHTVRVRAGPAGLPARVHPHGF